MVNISVSIFLVLFSALHVSCTRNFTGGTMKWQYTNSSTKTDLLVEARVFFDNAGYKCPNGTAQLPVSETFAVVPKFLPAAGGAPLNAVISNQAAFGCVDVSPFQGNVSETVVYTFSVSLTGQSVPITLRLDDTFKLIITINTATRVYSNSTEVMSTVNSSPRPALLRHVGIPKSQAVDIKIAAYDAELDDVRCRFATAAEFNSSDIGGSIDMLDSSTAPFVENCTIQVQAFPSSNKHGVALMMEDFVSKDSNVPLSAVPVWFIIDVVGEAYQELNYDFTINSADSDKCIPLVIEADENNVTSHTMTVNFPSTTLVTVARFSPLTTVLKDPVNTDGFGAWINTVNWYLPEDEYPVIEPFCFAGLSDQDITRRHHCFYVANTTSVPAIGITPLSPAPYSVQGSTIQTFQLRFEGSVDGLTESGTFAIYRSGDSSLVVSVTTGPSCTACSISDNVLSINVLFTADPTEENYYVNYDLKAAKYCSTSKPLNDSSWLFRAKTYVYNMATTSDLLNSITIDITHINGITAVSPYTAKLGELVNVNVGYVKDSSVTVMLYRCYATETADPNGVSSFDILNNGCPEEDSTIITSTANAKEFKFEAFRFIGSANSSVYVHCKLKVCLPDSAASCVANCGGSSRRKRRSIDESQLKHVTVGPIHVHHEDDEWTHAEITRELPDVENETENPNENDGEEEERDYFTVGQRQFMIAYTSICGLIVIGYVCYRQYDLVYNH